MAQFSMTFNQWMYVSSGAIVFNPIEKILTQDSLNKTTTKLNYPTLTKKYSFTKDNTRYIRQ